MRGLPLLVVGLLVVSGCADMNDLRGLPTPAERSDTEAVPERSVTSLEQEAFYTRLEENLITRGLLRTDGGGPDAPFTDEMVARNFQAIAFSEEFTRTGGVISARATSSTLHRWNTEILIEPVFGDTVTSEMKSADKALIGSYANRLARITGHEIRATEGIGNFSVFVLHEQDLVNLSAKLTERLPEISEAEVEFVETLPLEIYCLVFTSDPGNDGNISRGVAIIRAELPDALRTSCYHEELAQGLGLANDSDFARPSIFKDDDEFGRLTTHDEHLLSILYDDRLTPGMTETEAAPLVRQAARARLAPAS